MKKTFITKEYTQEARAGTFSMLEKRNFFGGKILEIDDVMVVDQNDIIWVEAADHTQGVNIDDQTKNLDTSLLKENNHTIQVYSQQSQAELLKFTTWQIDISIETIIRDWIFAQLKKYRTFQGIRNSEVRSSEIDEAIYEYIDYNVIPRIKFTTIFLYIRYWRIGEIDNQLQVALKFDAKYTEFAIVPPPISGESTDELITRTNIFKESIKATNFDLKTGTFGKTATILYKQTESSEFYKFDYYFDVVYEKA